MIALMGTISTTLGQVGVSEAGGGEALPIIFLHGVGSNKSVWRPQLVHFGKSRRTVAFDYPGYGESEFKAEATRDDFAASVLAAGFRRIIAFSCGPLASYAAMRAR